MIPPSITDNPYKWLRPLDIFLDLTSGPITDAALVRSWGAREDSPLIEAAEPVGPPDWDRLDSALALIDPDCDYDTWLKVLMGLHFCSGGSNEGFRRADAWSKRGKKYKGPKEVWSKWPGFGRSNNRFAPVTDKTIYALATEAGWEEPGPDPETLKAMFKEMPPLRSLKPAPAPVLVEPQLTKTNTVRGTLCNACLYLTMSLGTVGARWNLLAGAAEIGGRRVDDHKLGELRLEIECEGMYSVSKDLVAEAVRLVCHKDEYHPVREHLAALPAHDGVARLDTWLIDYLGVADTPYTRAVGRKFLISMIARAELPGCKADHMLVLGGPQDLGKSTVCHILVGNPEWFLDALPDISKDGGDPAMKALRGKWVVETGELAATRKSDQEDLKAFISRQVDDYRIAFDREQTSAPRQCVMIGTTNRDDFLRDDTGDRRY